MDHQGRDEKEQGGESEVAGADFRLADISGYQFHEHLHTRADAFTSGLDGFEALQPSILTDPKAMLARPEEMRNPDFYREESEAMMKSGADDYVDPTQRYQATAILNEYDLAARRRVAQLMRDDPAYRQLRPDSVEYFRVHDELVGKVKHDLRFRYGPPTCCFDGMTKLPLVSMYSETLYDPETLTRYRRHSLACPPSALRDAPQIAEAKFNARRMSVAYGLRRAGIPQRSPLNAASKLLPVEEEREAEEDLEAYKLGEPSDASTLSLRSVQSVRSVHTAADAPLPEA
ncbi:hypothetical protein GMRT_11980 [Giardia muris]|uniref:Uncharacterized protein n=1 Tax=Giardia muris TaxID=5742 RepID=A0A4Z1SP68_GIAMU|nr:hypothetical protein GMRT_11980 [Giardia muris]|eukprot:TNJ27612.1 hypothetical protein GMRT_11980 [Giardia muris]